MISPARVTLSTSGGGHCGDCVRSATSVLAVSLHAGQRIAATNWCRSTASTRWKS